MPRSAEQVDAATAAYWTRTDNAPAPGPTVIPASDPRATRSQATDPDAADRPEGPEMSDMNLLLDAVALGQAVVYVPISVAQSHAAVPGEAARARAMAGCFREWCVRSGALCEVLRAPTVVAWPSAGDLIVGPRARPSDLASVRSSDANDGGSPSSLPMA